MSVNTAKDASGTEDTGAPGRGRDGGARVSLQNLSRHFGPTRALDGLTLEIEPGELVALLGPSGCGKTTALRILAGFETTDSGSVTVDGRDVSHISPAKRDMGMVFQSYSLFPNMSALDNVAFGLRMRKQGTGARRARAGELLEMVGLAEQVQQYPHQLSGGQQQRVALARALAIEPSVLLLDEPLSALDAKVRLQLREQIRALQQRLHTTTLFVTHDQEEALSMADRVGVMRSGKLEQLATPSELYARPATAFVAEFVGTMNRIPGEADGDGRVRVLGRTLPITGDRPDGPLDALVRPEELRITAAPNGNGTAPGANGTAPGANGTAPGANGTVTIATFLGSITRIHALLSEDVTVMVDVPSAESAALAPGTSVQVSVAEAEVLVTGRR